jgi:hypothetical protein
MPNLNRFPLLGLWAREAAHRIGYNDDEANVIGHAYAVLYAIRANSPAKPGVKYKDKEAEQAAIKAKAEATEIEELEFGDDKLEVSRNPRGELIGRVGRAEPQTPQSYRYKIASKFPAGYHDKLQEAFRAFFEAYTPEKLNTRVIYSLYDQWKKSCAAGRMVDMDKVIAWCAARKPPAAKGAS